MLFDDEEFEDQQDVVEDPVEQPNQLYIDSGSEHQTFQLEQNGEGIQLRSATSRNSPKKIRDMMSGTIPYESNEGYVTRDSGRKIANATEDNYYRRVSSAAHQHHIEEQKEMSGYEAGSFSEVPDSGADQKYYSTTGNKKRQMTFYETPTALTNRNNYILTNEKLLVYPKSNRSANKPMYFRQI